ncbi:penicillin-binding protein [Streptomyces sp. A7024]|uniref:Penicillin-binding protein n=1 Tax=Streptomyces coryli TaxID=1128680 RepID=A0A6G4U5M8_9ACTN|nr:transglycosylase domain-containing protein [Streptomyces coryli]NGN67484.1 penicillin-binding protein [Streptomyces coryli]
MSEHRRKPPNGGGAGGRRRAAPPRGGSYGDGVPGAPGGRAAARRAAMGGGGGRRRAAGPGGPGGAGMASRSGGYGGGGGGGGRRGYGGGPGDYDGPRPRRRRPMPPPKKRFIDYPRSDRDGAGRWLPSWKQVLGMCVLGLGLLVGGTGIALAMVDIPQANDLAKQETNVYQYSDGTQMVAAGGGEVNRQVLDIEDIPKSMQNATIAAENETFEKDAGIDPMGIARAVFNMAKGGETQGGSTITQQYVKNYYLDQEQTLTRKARELLVSIKVGAKMSKDDILAGYLNTAYYGRGAYGIQAAAQAYFSKPASELQPDQSAFLAAVLNGPNFYDPAGGMGTEATPDKNRDRVETRQQWILDRMVKTSRLSATDRAKYEGKFPKVDQPHKARNLDGQKGYLVDLANNYVTANNILTKQQLDQGGYTIKTTFRKKDVNALAKAVEDSKKKNIDPKKRPKYDKYVQYSGASVEPRTGAIKAIYGGAGFNNRHYTNNADYTGVQVGSTFKPFVLAAALDKGVLNPDLGADQADSERTPVSLSSVFNGNNKVTLRNFDGTVWKDEKTGKIWKQKNDGGEDKGMVNLRTAMQYSVNTPFIQLGMNVGLQQVKEAAVDAGLSDDQFAGLSPTFSLGTSAPSAIRMAGAYATFAASGVQADPYSVEEVKQGDASIYKHEKKNETAFDPKVADNVTSSLQTVAEKGTGSYAGDNLGRPVAGKTGTTDENRSAWFVGYTPQLSTSIGMYRLDPDAKGQKKFLSMRGVGGQESIHGASYPTEIWTAYMKKALEGKEIKQFPVAPPIGEKVYGHGASPSPTPTPTQPTEQPTDQPSGRPTDEPTDPGGGKPTESCDPFDPTCQTDTGGETGGDTGGDTGGGFPSPSESGDLSTGGNGNGNGGNNGGLFP